MQRVFKSSFFSFLPSVGFGLFVFAALLLFQVALQNVHIGTTNGLGKSFLVLKFMSEPSWLGVDPSNVFYYPVYAFLCHILNILSIFPGLVWRQLAIINAVFAGVSAGFCYYFVYLWTEKKHVAFLASVAYCFSGYVFLHGLINEETISSYCFILLSTLLAIHWFHRPTLYQIAAVSVLFSVGWLFEWRVLFPSLPAFCVALFAAPAYHFSLRIFRVVFFCISMLIIPLALACWKTLSLGQSFLRIPSFMLELIWTGKAVDTGWAGFSVNKLWLLWSGLSEAVFAGRHVMDANWIHTSVAAEIFMGSAFFLILGASFIFFWPKQQEKINVRNAQIIGGVLFLSGLVFNAYSQPQDPQMQLNVAAWFLPAWVCLLSFFLEKCNASYIKRKLGPIFVCCLVFLPFYYTVRMAFEAQGYDANMQNRVKEIREAFSPDRTAYAIYSFDGIITWMALGIGEIVPITVETVDPIKNDRPHFKYIGFLDDIVGRPSWTVEEQAQALIKRISTAHSLGYRVVTPSFWECTDEQWVASFSTVVDSPEKTLFIKNALHNAFRTEKVFVESNGETWFELKPL